MNNELYHFGVKGMKWGKRSKTGYRSTSIRSAIARRSNDKVDRGFNNWKDNAAKRDAAIALGKQRTVAKIAYENNKSDKNLKSAYKAANKEYKKALKQNTTYRKGVVRQEVGQHASRLYLSEAKRVKRQIATNPSDKKALKKKYTSLMNKYDIERADARRAAKVGSTRSRLKAGIKRTMTMTAKAAAGAAAVGVGVAAVNHYVLNKRGIHLSAPHVGNWIRTAKNIITGAAGYMY